jgi:hypothetical protein
MADAPKLSIVPAAEREKTEVNESIVAILRRYLEKAEAGELVWVGMISVDHNDQCCWSTSSSTLKEHEVVGRIEQLKFLFLHGPQH